MRVWKDKRAAHAKRHRPRNDLARSARGHPVLEAAAYATVVVEPSMMLALEWSRRLDERSRRRAGDSRRSTA
jgi:hypothetical protein